MPGQKIKFYLYGGLRVGTTGQLKVCWGVAKLVKAPDFDSGIRRFESFFPSPT